MQGVFWSATYRSEPARASISGNAAVVAISATEQFDDVVAERTGDRVTNKGLQLGSHLTEVAFGDRLDDDPGEFVIERWANVEK
jgi:hypothetical protein